MRVFSPYIITFLLFASLASGGPIPGTEPQAKPGPPTHYIRRKPHTYSARELSMYKELSLLFCADRMMYPSSVMLWVGHWPVPRWYSEKPADRRIFKDHVVGCLPVVHTMVRKWAEYEYTKIASIENDTRNGAAGIKDLCHTRCEDPNFGNLKANTSMPKRNSTDPMEVAAFRACEAYCIELYVAFEEAVEDEKVEIKRDDKSVKIWDDITQKNFNDAVVVVEDIVKRIEAARRKAAAKATGGSGNKMGQGDVATASTDPQAHAEACPWCSGAIPPRTLADRFKAQQQKMLSN